MREAGAEWWMGTDKKKQMEVKVTLDPRAKRNPIIRIGTHIKIHGTHCSVRPCIWRKLVFILEHHLRGLLNQHL